MIRNLIFDFGKVLVDFDFIAFFRRIIPDEERLWAFAPVLYNDDLPQALDREERPFDEIMQEVTERNPEYEHEIRTFCRLYPDIVTGEVPGMRDLLTRLKAEGFRLYGLTNWCSKVHITMKQYGIFQLLDGSIISSEEHLIKPEPAIYQRLFDKYSLKPEECLFTDDKSENIEGARQLGMDGIVFSNAEQYERELRRILKEKKDHNRMNYKE